MRFLIRPGSAFSLLMNRMKKRKMLISSFSGNSARRFRNDIPCMPHITTYDEKGEVEFVSGQDIIKKTLICRRVVLFVILTRFFAKDIPVFHHFVSRNGYFYEIPNLLKAVIRL